MATANFRARAAWEKGRSDIRTAISVAAPYDLNTLSWGSLWAPGEGDVQAARRQASPMFHISAKSLVIHSDDDQSVPIQQALDMVKALAAAKTPHKFVHYKDRGHMGLTDEVLQEARTFIATLAKAATDFDAAVSTADRREECRENASCG